MKTISLSTITICVLLLGICLGGCAHNRASLLNAATPEEAKKLLNEAVSFYKANGNDKAFAEINNPNGKFRRGDLYIFVYDSNGVVAAHGANVNEVGRDIMNLQDNNGKFFTKEIMQIGEAGGAVDYVWLNPVTGKVQPKKSFIAFVDGFRFGCGVYQ